jgi:hypothetical protein
VCLDKGLQVAVLDAVVSSGCLCSPQLALLDPLQDRVGLNRAKSCRFAGGEVLRFVGRHVGASGIYGFNSCVDYSPLKIPLSIDIPNLMSETPDIAGSSR